MVKKALDYLGSVAFLAVCGLFIWKTLSPTPSQNVARGSRPPIPIPTEALSLNPASMKGSPGAKAGIVVFSDFQCPFCGEFARTTLVDLEREYVAPGRVLLSYNHLPLQRIHPEAFKAAEAAECAGEQGLFWRMHDQLFDDPTALHADGLIQKARAAGLQLTTFESCLQESRTKDRVARDLRLAQSLRVASTPTLMIGRIQPDGRLKVAHVLPGLQQLDALRPLLDAIAPQPSARAGGK